MQGFFHSRPLTFSAIEAWLNARRLVATKRLGRAAGGAAVIIPVLGLLAVLSPVLAGG